MPNETHYLTVRMLANGVTAQVRVIASSIGDDDGGREEARRLHAELTRIATELARKHNFQRERRDKAK